MTKKDKGFWNWLWHNAWFYIITLGWITIEIITTYNSDIPAPEFPLISWIVALFVYFSIWIGIFAIFYWIRKAIRRK
jgi:hypothetical protein